MREATGVREAGGFTYRLGTGDLGAIAQDGRELVRRIFVTVRDRNWREVPISAWRAFADGEDGLVIEASHAAPQLAFSWRGLFRADGHGFELSIIGHAMCDMEVCRLGLVVLLPDRPFIGAHLRSTGPSGDQELVLPAQIAPQTIVDGVPQSMLPAFEALQIDDGRSRISLTFSGDLFELEDQRNWSDASFKIYCTPLALGFPRQIEQGAVVEQTVKAVVLRSPETPGRWPLTRGAVRRPDPCKPLPFPSLGAVADVFELKSEIVWRRLRVDAGIVFSSQLSLQNLPPHVLFDLAVACGEVRDDFITHAIDVVGGRLGEVLLLDARSDEDVTTIRRLFAAKGFDPPVRLGTSGHFVEFNRGQALPRSGDGVAFPLTPTAHLWDRWTIAENVAPIDDMVFTARALSGSDSVAISPLALFHPAAPTEFPRELVLPWFAAQVCACAHAGIASIALARELSAALLSSATGTILLKRLMSWDGRPAVPVKLAEAPHLHGAVVRLESGRLDAIVANVSAHPLTIEGRTLLSGLAMEELDHLGRPASVWRPGAFRIPPEAVLVAQQ